MSIFYAYMHNFLEALVGQDGYMITAEKML